MAITPEQKTQLKNVIKDSLRTKFKNYNPETKHMPFHYRLLGKDRMALFSFIHSLNTTFGTSIYEPVAIQLSKNRFVTAKTQETPYNIIYSDAQIKIQEIMNRLTRADNLPNSEKEIEELRSVCRSGEKQSVNLTKIDVWLENTDNEIYMMDIKTVKPNIGGFQKHKQTLLEWIASELARNPNAKVQSVIAIPYNPYEPDPYQRWTLRGMLDIESELLVAEEMWDFIGGNGTYENLLDCFEEAGIELRPEIDGYFKRFK